MKKKITTKLTHHEKTEQELKEVNRALRMITLCNQCIVSAHSEQNLLNDICKIIVKHGSYRMAWIGYAENDEKKTVRPIAHAGFEDGYLKKIHISWGNNEFGRGPTGRAVRTEKTHFVPDVRKNASFKRWLKETSRRGYASSISLPIKDNTQSEVYGALNIYSEKINAFNKTEISLLEELAGDLALGITVLRLRAHKEQSLKAALQERNKLKESEEKFRALFKNSPDGIILADIESKKFYDANPAICRMLGYNLDELQNLGVADIHPAKDLPYVMDIFKKQARKEIILGENMPVKRKDGSVFYAEIYTLLIRFMRKTYMAGIFRDITERKIAEQRLLDLTDFNSKIIENSTTGVLVYNSDWQCVIANQAAADIIGGTKKILLQLNFRKIKSWEGSGLLAAAEKALKEDIPVKHETNVTTTFGKEVYLVCQFNSFTSGGQKHLLLTLNDILYLKKNEQKLQRQKDLLSGIHEIFKEVLRDENEEALAKRCLDVAQKLTESKFGIIEEINEKNLLNALAVSNPGWKACDIPREKAKKLLSDLEIHGMRGKIVTEGEPIVTDNFASHPSYIGIPTGHPRIITFMGVPLKHEDKIIGEMSVANKEGGYDEDNLINITTLASVFVEALMRKRAEENLKRLTIDVMQSNQDLERFAIVISHDLQEPLISASNFIQLLSKRYGDKLDKDAEDFIGYAINGMKWMQKLINDLLEYSRLSAKGKVFEKINTDSLLKDALKNLDAIINKTSAVITYDELPVITGDPVQITQLFQNLISNSLKFGGAETPKIHISAEKKENNWVFHFKDNGIGFEPEHADRIFGVFTRLHKKGDYPGTGIGLAICKKIVERHKGKIWAEGALGEGANFYFTIPE